MDDIGDDSSSDTPSDDSEDSCNPEKKDPNFSLSEKDELRASMALRKKEHELSKRKTSESIESQYVVGEDTALTGDIYGMTIAANMTKNCSPINLIIALRYCFFVFVIQLLIAYYFSYDKLGLNEFQDFDMFYTSLRLICSCLL